MDNSGGHSGVAIPGNCAFALVESSLVSTVLARPKFKPQP